MAGAGYKSWVDGDVLSAGDVNTYLMEQAVMVFADASARSTAITAPSEGMVTYLTGTNVIEYYDGAAWVGINDADAIQNSIVDAKGDLIAATADNTPARLAVGSDGQYLKADSGEATGLVWSTIPTGKILQVIQGTTSTTVTISTTAMTDTGLTATITPSAATSKILVMTNQSFFQYSTGARNEINTQANLLRDSTVIQDASSGVQGFARLYLSSSLTMQTTGRQGFIYLDSPATTSAITYKTQAAVGAANENVSFQPNSLDSAIILIEVGA